MECVDVSVLVDTEFSCGCTEFLLVGMLREYLAADDASEYGSVIKGDGNAEVYQSGVAGVYTRSLTITFFAAFLSLCAAAGQVDAELGKVVAVAAQCLIICSNFSMSQKSWIFMVFSFAAFSLF